MKSNVFFLLITLMIVMTLSCGEKTVEKKTASGSLSGNDSLQLVADLISQDSLDPKLWKLQYQLFRERADTVQALKSLRMYNYLAPEDGEGWLEMAGLLANLKNPGALVITDSLALVKDDMIKTRAKYIRGLYYSNIQQDDIALRAFDSTILFNYTFIDAYIEKGIILYDRKDYNAALKTFQQAFKIVNNNPELYYWIGQCYMGLGNKGEAADWQKKYEALK